MTNSAFKYHLHTSYQRDKMAGHYLDWPNQPTVFKDYPGISPVVMPSHIPVPREELSSLLKGDSLKDGGGQMDVAVLSLILRLACTLTAKARHSGGDFYFRSVASAGALYPTEIYVATNGVKGLHNGLYHFAVHRHCFYPIRQQGLSPHFFKTVQIPGDKEPLLTFFLTAIFFRSAWKYRDRSYRYHLLDTGHLAENLIMALKSQRLPFDLSFDFDDKKVNDLLGLDETKEVALTVINVPGNDPISHEIGESIDELPENIRRASRVSGKEVDYPVIREIHRAGSWTTSPKRSAWEMPHELGILPETWTEITRPLSWPQVMNYPEAVFNRRSRRNFVKEPMGEGCMAALLDALCIKDFSHPTDEKEPYRSVSTGFLAGDVEGMKPGFYLLDTEKKAMGLVNHGHFMDRMAHICLDQAWLVNAAAHFLFLANLDGIDHTWGARGYRYAMITAGCLGERLYVAATAMGMGCCGIGAFYDGEAAALLGLDDHSRLLYLVAVGPVKGQPQ